MVLKPTKEFLTEALTNNTFDVDSTDNGLRASLDNSFSYLYRLQKNLIQYEEFLYTTRNTVKNFYKDNVIADSPELGDMYFDDKRRVCIDFGVELIPVNKRESYRDPSYWKNESDFYGKEIEYKDLLSHNELFYRIPILIFDNKVLRDFKVKVFDDHFVAILPLGEYFMREKKYDIEHNETYYAAHNYSLQIINNTNYIDKVKQNKTIGFFDLKTNRGMLKQESGNDSYGKLSGSYIINSLSNSLKDELGEEITSDNFTLYTEDAGCYFAVVYLGDELLGSNLIDVTVNFTRKNGKNIVSNVVLDYDENTKEKIDSYSGDITIRFIFYRYLKKYNGSLGKFIQCREKMIDEEEKASSNIFMLTKNDELTNYGMPIPKEDLIVFKVSENDITETGYKEWKIISNEKVTQYYPSNYQIINEKEKIYTLENGYYYTIDGKKYDKNDQYMLTEDITEEELEELIDSEKVTESIRWKIRNIEPNDKIRVYYFYYPEYDLHYENMYQFFYYYLKEKWGLTTETNKSIEEIINAIYFGDLLLDDQFEISDEKLKELITVKNASIMLTDADIQSVQSTYQLFFGDTNELIDTDLFINGDITEEEKMTLVAYKFYTIFNNIIFHDIVDYVYDDIDYMLGKYDESSSYEENITSLEYKVKKLKEFIKDDPEALRKYVLCQNKTSIKYEFDFTKEQAEKRIRTKYEETDGGDLPQECYLFMFEHVENTDFFSCRIFIDGFLYTNYYQKAYEYQDFIYIPTTDLPIGSYVEIETFPSYMKKNIVTFTEENDSVVLEFPDGETIKPTLSDIFFRNPISDNEYFSRDKFKFEYISDDYNYYKMKKGTNEPETITGYVVKNECIYYSGTYINMENEHSYVFTLKQNDPDPDGNITTTRGYSHFDSSGEFIEFISEGNLPSNVVRQRQSTVVYKNPVDLDYYAKDYSYKDFYHYDSTGAKLSDQSYKESEITDMIASGANYTVEFDKVYKLNIGSGYYLSDGSYYTFNGQRVEEKDLTEEEITPMIESGTLYPLGIYETDNKYEIHWNNHYISYDKVIGGNSSIDHDNGVIQSRISKIKITCLDYDLFDREIEISIKKDSSIISTKMEYTNYPCIDIGLNNEILTSDRYENTVTGEYYGKDIYYDYFYHYNSMGYRDEIDPDTGKPIFYTRDEVEELIDSNEFYTHTRDVGSNEYIRVFRDGRLISKNRYELLLNEGEYDYGYPRVQLLDIIEKDSMISVDVTPYRNKLVYYQRELECDKTEDILNPNILTVNLQGYIDKPFDINYFEVYLNGRRISRNNIYPAGPFEIKLAGVHSIHNLEIYEKDRDWEYYGCDYKTYYTISDMIREAFMEDSVRDKMVEDVTGETPDNHVCEDPQDYERDLSIETYFFEAFYYNRLLPKGLANGDLTTFIHNDIRYNFPLIYDLYYRYDSHEVTPNQYTISIDSYVKESIEVKNEPTNYDSICFNDEINGKRFVAYAFLDHDYTPVREKEIQVFIGDGFDTMSKKITFVEFGFDIGSGVFDLHVVKCLGYWYMFSKYSQYYYMSNDTEKWYRKRITISDSEGIRYHLKPEGFLPFNEKLGLFGNVYYSNDEVPTSRCVIESYDGKHWMIVKTLTDEEKDANLTYTNQFYDIGNVYAKKDETMYKVNSNYTLRELKYDGKPITSIEFDQIIFMNDIIYILLNDKVLYSTNKYEFMNWNTDVIKEFEEVQITYVYGLYVYQIKKQHTSKYEYYISTDGISIERYEIPFTELEDASTPHDLYHDSNANTFMIFDYESSKGTKELYKFSVIKTINEGVKEVDASHVLLLDPDVYYHGEDKDRWNVYMTGNDDNFMDNL